MGGNHLPSFICGIHRIPYYTRVEDRRSGVMEHWSNGVLEDWNVGIMGD